MTEISFSNESLQNWKRFLTLLIGPDARFRTQRALADAMGLPESVISRIFRPEYRYRVEIEPCLRLALATGHDPLDVLRLAGQTDAADLLLAIFGPARQLEPLSTLDILWMALSDQEKDALIRAHTAVKISLQLQSRNVSERMLRPKSTGNVSVTSDIQTSAPKDSRSRRRVTPETPDRASVESVPRSPAEIRRQLIQELDDLGQRSTGLEPARAARRKSGAPVRKMAR